MRNWSKHRSCSGRTVSTRQSGLERDEDAIGAGQRGIVCSLYWKNGAFFRLPSIHVTGHVAWEVSV